jgi:hypothetical protein
MADAIQTLANIVDLKKTDRKCVLMLGAGASLSSGVKPTGTIMEELVAKYYGDGPDPVRDRFDELWRRSSNETRRQFLEPYLTKGPSVGYAALAELLKAGFFDTVITYNFDRLLEEAMNQAGLLERTHYRVITRGESEPPVIVSMMEASEPRIKILKLHGSLLAADFFLFSDQEMLNYPPEISKLLLELTGRDIIICGYAFTDTCVVKAFNDNPAAGHIYCVDPAGPPTALRGYMKMRRSQTNVFRGDQGRFDEFFVALRDALLKRPAPASLVPRQNIFKFLDHYQEEHTAWFLGRRKLTREMVRLLTDAPPPLLVVSGRPQAGKTSFIRAGLIPNLPADRFMPIYVRCARDLEPQLRAVFAQLLKQDLSALDWDAILTQVKASTTKQIVLFLDQFERPARAWAASRENADTMFAFLRQVVGAGGGNLSVVCAGLDGPMWKLLAMAGARFETREIEPLSPRKVFRIVGFAAKQAGTRLANEDIRDICSRYEQTLKDQGAGERRPFTLTHVQTACYYLAKGQSVRWEGFDRFPNLGLQAALTASRDDASLTDLMDDLPVHERRLIRSFLKVICDPSGNTTKVVEFIRDHFPELAEDRFPEPIA